MNNEHKDYYRAVPISTEYTYDLDDEVTEVSDYRELISLLRYATENDVVRININNYGGHLTTCIAIVNAIRNCQATTIGSLTGVAYSAAGAILLACDVQEIGNHVGFMAHPANGGDYGTLHQRQQSIKHTLEMLRSLYEDVYEGFLSKEEIDSILKQDDVWLNEKEIKSRLEKRNEYFENKLLEQEIQDTEQLEEMFNVPDEKILNKLTKSQLVRYIKGEIDVDPDTGEITEVEDEL